MLMTSIDMGISVTIVPFFFFFFFWGGGVFSGSKHRPWS